MARRTRVRTAAHAERVGGSAGLESVAAGIAKRPGFARAGRACMAMQRRDC